MRSSTARSARTFWRSSQWPVFSGLVDAEVDEEIGWVVRLISEIRSVRTEMNVPVAAKMPLALPNAGAGAARARQAARGHDQPPRPPRQHHLPQGGRPRAPR